MFHDSQINRLKNKIQRFADTLEPMIFQTRDTIDFQAYVTKDSLYECPADDLFNAISRGDAWYGKDSYLWLKTGYTVPQSLDGLDLFIKPHVEGYEALLFVNGQAKGTFATKIVYTGHGNHYCDLMKAKTQGGETLSVVIEFYGGHDYPGYEIGHPGGIKNYNFIYNGADICTKNSEISDYYFDLMSVIELVDTLPADSFMRGKAINALYAVQEKAYLLPEDTTPALFMQGLRETAPILKQVLANRSGDSAPQLGLIGHSHMDTAWLWHIGETKKKVARTYANQLSLMEQYPEYRFVQSSSLHGEFIRQNYPELFERIREAVASGRYEPNGAVWVECDCNITGGEAMIRQFLWGQRFTRKYYNYTADCFWLPDTFGYSAAIPQIMKGCDVKYFLTTKLSWNDTNAFPYDSFWWEGIDGTRVLTHFNTSHHFPAIDDIWRITHDIKQKSVTGKRLAAYGYGDGGGGPMFEMIELARRAQDLAEVGKTYYTSVSDFMDQLEKELTAPNTYRGELYLELHRGTLTNQHTIKRNNRKAELILRDLELFTVNEAVRNHTTASEEKIAPLYEALLVNQFHDILPGTCITRAHEESRAQTGALIRSAGELIGQILGDGDNAFATLTNTLSFDRQDPLFIELPKGKQPDADCKMQRYTDIHGTEKWIVSGLTVPAFSGITLPLKDETTASGSPFVADGRRLETPYYSVVFAENMTICSLIDKRAGRELCGEGYALNTFVMAEDAPASWDNWDIDADIQLKYKPVSDLESCEVVSNGEAAYILRLTWRISEKSTIRQDMIFFADSPEIRFDTVMDWQDDHRFLKTCFDTNIRSDYARNEIQFGHVLRPTTRNNSLEQAKFEVVNHKYTDLSETRYGAAVLNDCKYGISVEGGQMRLSLHKGGTHPDAKGDHDCPHSCVYSFLPHDGSFSAESVIRPAYCLNVPVRVSAGKYDLTPPVTVEAANVIVETVKPCEDAEKAYIVRLYEAEGTQTTTALRFPTGTKLELVNMLEERLDDFEPGRTTFRPFEIKSIKVTYA